MGYGTSYTQMQQADALRAAADSGGGDGLAGLGIGAMGMSAMQQQQQMMQQQQLMQQQAAAAAAAAAASTGATESAAAPAGGGSASGGMPDVMTPAQAAEIVQVTEADIIAAIEAGDLKARKIGSAYRISKANMELFLNG